MSVDMQIDTIVQISLIEHLRTALTAEGWSDTSDWVVAGYIDVNPTSRPPVVGVHIPETHRSSFEVGSTSRQGHYTVEIEVWGANITQLQALLTCISKNVDCVQLVDFNTAMPGDDGYDADAQEIGRGDPMGDVVSRIVDEQDYTGRVSFILRESKPN